MGETITCEQTMQEQVSKLTELFESFKALMDRKLLTRVIALEDKAKDLLTKNTEERVSKDILEERLCEFIQNQVAGVEKRMEDQIIQMKMQIRNAMVEFTNFITDFQQMKSALRSQLRDTIKCRDGMLEISDRLSVLQKESLAERIRIEESMIQCREQVQSQWELLKHRNAENEEFKMQMEIIRNQFIESSKELESFKRNNVGQDGCESTKGEKWDDIVKSCKKAEKKFKNDMKNLSSTLQDAFEKKIEESLEKHKQDLLLNAGKDLQERIENDVIRIKEELGAHVTEIQDCRDDINKIEEYVLKLNEQQATFENEVGNLNFGLESLHCQLTELNEKLVELQLVVIKGKNFWDEMCIKHSGQLSAQELYGVIADVGLKYEMMKELITKRVHNLESLREKLSAFERSTKSRAELEKKVTYLTASVENVQSLIYSTQDSFSSVLAKNCLTNFKDSWPLDASLELGTGPKVWGESTSVSWSKANSRANDDALSSEEYVGLSSFNLDLPPSTLEFEGHSSSNLDLSSTLECDGQLSSNLDLASSTLECDGQLSSNLDLASSTSEYDCQLSSNLDLASSTLECDWTVVQ